MPAHDTGGNLVAEREHQHRGMMAKLAHPAEKLAANTLPERSIVEERHVLRPGKAHHHPQAVPRGFVEQIAPRRCVDADRVQAEPRHQTKVLGDLAHRRELIPLGVGRKRAIRHALDEKPLAAGAQELAVRHDSRVRDGRRVAPDLRVDLNSHAHGLVGLLQSSEGKTLLYQVFGVIFGPVAHAYATLRARPSAPRNADILP